LTALRVVIDGAPLEDAEARAFWKRFSAWMDEHRGDLAGFARTEGLASVHPEMHGGGPVLVGSRSAPQRAYVTAPTRSAAGGSTAVHQPGKNPPAKAGNRTGPRNKPPRKRG
jgi:hypothetical protein